jgi:hypothetical protein
MPILPRLAFSLALAATVATAADPASSPPAEKHVRGVITALEGSDLKVRSSGGQELTLVLTSDTRVAIATRAGLGDIGQGGYVGTTALPLADGSLRAVEVHVFPEAMRGAGEGHRPWDLEAGSTMTNATVSSVSTAAAGAQSTMTNATVKGTAMTKAGLKLDLKYPAGEQTVLVPPGTPVVKLAPSDPSHLVPGAHLFAAYAVQPDEKLRVLRVVVGAEGVRPPM